MTKHIEAQLNTDSVREPAEPAVHRKASPRHAILIPQKPAFGPFLDQPLHDCDCRVRQVNNTHTFLTFCLPGGKNQPCGMELNVSGFQPEQLLRSCSRFPSQGDKIFESLVRDKCPETCVQLGTYDELAGSCFWLFEIRNGRAINVAKLDRPVKRSLHGKHAAATHSAIPARVRVGPLLHMEGSKLRHGQGRGHRFDEALQPFFIPVVGPGSPVLLTPVEKGIDNGNDVIAWHDGRWNLSHQLVIPGERSHSISAEIDLLTPELDVIEPTTPTKKRLGKVRHNEPPSFPGGPKVRRLSCRELPLPVGLF